MFRTAIKSFVGTASVVAAGLAVLSSPAWAGKPLPPVVPTSGPTPISECQEISEPGSYVLVNNLAYTYVDQQDVTANPACLLITADFVTIDLGGFTISNSGSSGATGILAFPPNPPVLLEAVSVSNGVVTGFSNGVNFMNADDAAVHNVRAVNNLASGLVLRWDSQVTNNILSHNGQGTGPGTGAQIYCPSVVTGNIAIGNNTTGILLTTIGAALPCVEFNNAGPVATSYFPN